MSHQRKVSDRYRWSHSVRNHACIWSTILWLTRPAPHPATMSARSDLYSGPSQEDHAEMAVDRSDKLTYPRSSTLLNLTILSHPFKPVNTESISTPSTMSTLSETARLSSNPEHDIMLQDPHPDLLDPTPNSSETKPARMTGGGMRAAMTAGYDPSTKLATGTTMAEYKRINMRATTIGMWGGLAAGGLVSEYFEHNGGH